MNAKTPATEVIKALDLREGMTFIFRGEERTIICSHDMGTRVNVTDHTGEVHVHLRTAKVRVRTNA